MEISFILVQPAVPENVGFSLRAMKTMGFSNLRIVGEMDIREDGLRKTAYGSHDLLNRVQYFQSFRQSISDMDLVVGTTSKNRTSRKDVIDPSGLLSHLQLKQNSVHKVAIAFGSEENGLSNEDINQCHIVSTIPLQVDYPSLNLAQAVMIFAYELSRITRIERNEVQKTNSLYKAMIEQGDEIFDWLEMGENPVLLRRLKDRLSLAGDTDINMILAILKKLRRKKSGH